MKKSYLHGYGADWAGLDQGIFYFSGRKQSSEEGEVSIAKLHEIFNHIQDHYDSVPFYEITQEMEAEDWDDFASLFRVREVLPNLKAVIGAYVLFLRQNEYYAPEETAIAKKMRDNLKELFEAGHYKGVIFRERIVQYDPSFKSEPAPNNPPDDCI